MAYNSTVTKTRLLEAALIEFAERGLAGARVDRIAATAGVNKQAIYAYFGSKEQLFNAVLARRLGTLADAVPFTADDLPSYAGALFDYCLDNPHLMRLTLWKQLEGIDASSEEREVYVPKIDDLSATYRFDGEPGVDAASQAVDLLLLTMAIAKAWVHADPAIRNLGDADPERRLATHRASVISSVAAIVDALTLEHA